MIRSVMFNDGNQIIKGKDATKSPAAGVGNPLKENCCSSSKLNFANLQAAAHGIIKAGKRNAIETSKPPSSFA